MTRAEKERVLERKTHRREKVLRKYE
jgi:hypothetical protein